jgi:Xaa-Pro aminopeptidase
MVFVGIDWSEKHHDVEVLAKSGQRLKSLRIAHWRGRPCSAAADARGAGRGARPARKNPAPPKSGHAYATGSRFVFVGMDAPTALAPQSAAIITQDADIYCQRFSPFDTDDVALHTNSSESIELYDDELELVNILRDYGIGAGHRVGTEWGPGLCVGINPIKFAELQRRLREETGAEIVDATTTIWKWMAIKSALEIERMKVAVTAAAEAMERVYQGLEVGMNELAGC